MTTRSSLDPGKLITEAIARLTQAQLTDLSQGIAYGLDILKFPQTLMLEPWYRALDGLFQAQLHGSAVDRKHARRLFDSATRALVESERQFLVAGMLIALDDLPEGPIRDLNTAFLARFGELNARRVAESMSLANALN